MPSLDGPVFIVLTEADLGACKAGGQTLDQDNFTKAMKEPLKNRTQTESPGGDISVACVDMNKNVLYLEQLSVMANHAISGVGGEVGCGTGSNPGKLLNLSVPQFLH